jgi:tetratricopeptide (TPR) repeat protein
MRIKLLLLLAILFLGFETSLSQVKSNTGQDAASWVKEREAQLQQTANPAQRLHQLVYLAPAALAARDTEKARAFARELLALGETTKTAPGFGASNYGQATFTGNTVLGLIAINANDVQKAKEHLLASARISGSPVLKSFGPAMLLAKELIEKGERDAAIEYFDLVAKFWTNQNGKLDRWKASVKKGETPDFGTNLRTGLDIWRFAQ